MGHPPEDALEAEEEIGLAEDVQDDGSEPSASEGIDEDRTQLPLIAFGS